MIRDPQVVCGIGDDCAIIKKDKKSYWLLTTDCLKESVHFTLKNYSAKEIGLKAISVSLSDIAAMGGRPLYLLINLGLPKNVKQQWVKKLYQGINHQAKKFRVSVVGGNISCSPNGVSVDVMVVGEVLKEKCKFRSGARKGDIILVSGPLGLATAGLYKIPAPLIELGNFLGSSHDVTSMIDVSDGLLQDLGHILKESGVGGVIAFNKIPYHPKMSKLAGQHQLSFPDLILGGGEDYQLLFTVKKEALDKLISQAKKKGFVLTPIGKIVSANQGLKVLKASGQQVKFSKKGYDHFR